MNKHMEEAQITGARLREAKTLLGDVMVGSMQIDAFNRRAQHIATALLAAEKRGMERAAEIHAALKTVKRVLDEIPDHINDDLWVSETETLGAFVDAALGAEEQR